MNSTCVAHPLLAALAPWEPLELTSDVRLLSDISVVYDVYVQLHTIIIHNTDVQYIIILLNIAS